MLLPGDEIIFDREPGDFWAFVEDPEAPPAPPGIVRVKTADPRDFAGHRALVIQQVPWQSVHRYDRWMEKFHDYEDGPLDPLKLYHPIVGSEWYLVLCNDRLLYAGLVSPKGADEADAGDD